MVQTLAQHVPAQPVGALQNIVEGAESLAWMMEALQGETVHAEIRASRVSLLAGLAAASELDGLVMDNRQLCSLASEAAFLVAAILDSVIGMTFSTYLRRCRTSSRSC